MTGRLFGSLAGWVALLALSVALSSQVGRIDNLTSPPSPWASNYPTPLPLPLFNPMGLQRSAIGKTLGIALIDQSNRAFHVGMGKVIRVKAISHLGRFLEYLNYQTHWRPHFHATPQAAMAARGVDHLVLTAASDKTEMAVKWAYYFDPTNYDAYDLVEYVLEADPSAAADKIVDFRDPDGTLRKMSTARARALLFAYYAMTQFPDDDPDGCLSRAGDWVNIWLLTKPGGSSLSDRTKFWKSTAGMMDKIGYWLNRSELMREREVSQGVWRHRSVMALDRYENHMTLTFAIWQQTLLQYHKWQKTHGA
jgi:hypothetical protein